MKRKPALKAKPLFPNQETSEPQEPDYNEVFHMTPLSSTPVALVPIAQSEVDEAAQLWMRFIPEDGDPNMAVPLATLYLLKQVVQQLDRIARLLES